MSVTSHLQKPIKTAGTLALHYVGDIAVIVMDGGENRLNPAFLKNFMLLLDEVESNPSCKGLITTGKGKFFSNGLDLQELSTLDADGLMDFFVSIHVWLLRLLLFPIPTLAAINGHAFAGGALLVYAHDLRVQNQDRGWLCVNEVWINRTLAKFHYTFLRLKLGHTYTDAVALGKRYTAKEALEARAIHMARPEALLMTESLRLLKSQYGKSGYIRESLGNMKKDVYKEAIEHQQQDLAMLPANQKSISNTFTAKL